MEPMKSVKPSKHDDSAHGPQQALRTLSVSRSGWRLHLLLPFSLLVSLMLILGLPILVLILVDHPATAEWLRTWIRWAGLPASVSTLCIYHFARKRLLEKSAANGE